MRKYATAIVIALTFSVGCGDTQQDCQYWVKQLQQGKKEKKSLEMFAELGATTPKLCDGATEAMADAFPESLYRREIIAALKVMGKSERAVEVVRAALPDKEVGPIAITLALEWKVDSLREDLQKLIKSQRSASSRLQALEAFVKLNGPDGALDTLVWVAGQEPTLQGVDSNRYAADQLAKVDWSKQTPEVGEKAAQNLIRALFLKDGTGSSAQINARFALRAIGPPATGAILGAFKGVNKELNEFAQVRGLPKWKYTQGHELVEMLWDVGDRRASPELMESIGIPLDPPPADVMRLPEDARTEWKNANQNRLSTIAMAVGALVNDEAVPYAVDLMKRKDPAPDASQFVKAGLALGLMGTAKARAAMWQLFRAGDSEIATKKAKIEELKSKIKKEKNDEKKRALMKEHDGFIDAANGIRARKANYIINLAVGLHPDDISSFKKEVMGIEKGPIKESVEGSPIPEAYFELVEKCKKDAACYATKISDLKGKLKDLPGAIRAATKALSDKRKELKGELKPINDKIKEKQKARKDAYKAILDLKKEIEAIQKNKARMKKEEKAYKALIAKFNGDLDVLNAYKPEIDKLYAEYNTVLAQADPLKAAIRTEQKKMHTLEKAALMLGNLTEAKDLAVNTLTSVFMESDLPEYAQFRQWTIIALEHSANASHAKSLEDLLEKESRKGERTTYYSLRLESLLKRIKRTAK